MPALNGTALPRNKFQSAIGFLLCLLCLQTTWPVLAQSENARGWDKRFNLPMVDPHLALAGDRDYLYVSGNLTNAVLARWDGRAWTDLPWGTPDSPMITSLNGTLFAYYPRASIYQWRGDRWRHIGRNIEPVVASSPEVTILGDPDIHGLAWRNANLYAHGRFRAIDGTPSFCVARWDGAAWHRVGSTNGWIPNRVEALFWVGDIAYAYGDFLTDPSTETQNTFAKLLGENWTEAEIPLKRIENPVTWDVGVVSSAGLTYFSGDFEDVGSAAFSGVAIWDGTNWHAPPLHPGGRIFKMIASPDGVIVAQGKSECCSATVYRLRGIHVEIVGEFNRLVYDLAAFGTNIVAAGHFDKTDQTFTGNFAISDGTGWRPVLEGNFRGFNGAVKAMVGEGADVYAIGEFTHAGLRPVSSLVRWQGQEWISELDGFEGELADLAQTPQALFVGGNFQTIGGIAATNIAQKTETGWKAVGEGLAGTVYDIAADEDQLFAVTAGHIWELRNAHWVQIAQSNDWGAILCSAVFHNEFYIGGMIRRIDGLPVSHIARWDGKQWSDLNGGVNGGNYLPEVVAYAFVGALAEWNGALIVGGSFTNAGGVASRSLAGWTGDSWFNLGPDLGERAISRPINEYSEYDLAIALLGTENGLYIAAYDQFGRWDGRKLSWIEGGTYISFAGLHGDTFCPCYPTAAVRAMAAIGDQIFLGGDFAWVSATPSYGFAIWHETPALFIERKAEEIEIRWPSWATNYVLQTANQLAPGAWVHSRALSPVRVPAPPTGPSRYYRLQRTLP